MPIPSTLLRKWRPYTPSRSLIKYRGTASSGKASMICCAAPFCGGMLRHTEMHQAPPLMRQNHEDKQHSQLHRGYCKEVDGDQLANMVRQKGFPCLGWLLPPFRH